MSNPLETKSRKVTLFSSIIFIVLQGISSVTPQLAPKYPGLLLPIPPPTSTPPARPNCFQTRPDEATPVNNHTVVLSGHGQYWVGITQSGQIHFFLPGPHEVDPTDPIVELHKCQNLQDAQRFFNSKRK